MATNTTPDLDAIRAALRCDHSACDCRRANGNVHCPGHEDPTPSLSVTKGDRVPVVWKCHGGCDQERVRTALVERGLIPPPVEKAKRNGHGKKIVATYDYRDATGALRYQQIRYEPKDFRARRPDGAGGWVWNLDGVERIVFGLLEWSAGGSEPWRCWGEGEKDVLRLRELGFVSTTTSQGSAGIDRYSADHLRAVARGHRIAIFPDADDAGAKYAMRVADAIVTAAAEVRIVRLPGLAHGQDVSDWLDKDHTKADLLAEIDAAPRWEPRKGEAGCAILDDVHAFIGRFVAYPSEEARIAHALWLAHTHLMDAWESTPRIAFLSPEPASGKTRALEVSELLVPNPVEAVNVTAAYLFRRVGEEGKRATVLFDEVDTVFGPKAKEHEDVRGLLNAGHRRGAIAGRCVTHGKTIETVDYPAYCAVALAGLGDLPDTILTRSVIVKMRRRGPGERVEPYRRRLEEKAGHALRDRLARWATDTAGSIGNPWPMMPAGIEDRDADVWEALLAVADAAGGAWPERARVAAVALVAASKGETPSLGIRLLSDLRTVFGDRASMPTDDILKALTAIDEAPWPEIVNGKPLNALGLSQRLRSYNVKSRNMRSGPRVVKGYTREDLLDAWTRYLPPSPQEGATPATSATGEESAGDQVDSTRYNEGESATSATGDEPENSRKQAGFDDGVADVAGVAGFRGNRGGVTSTDESVADWSPHEPATSATNGRFCVECGIALPVGWTHLYCAKHGGTSGDARSDPRFPEALAEAVAMSAEEYAQARKEELWIGEHEPDAEDHAFVWAVLAEAGRLRTREGVVA